MERIFIQSVLFSTAILVVYALASPPQSLSAESHPPLDPSVHVRKGTVITVDPATANLVINFDGVSVSVATNASTTITSSNGENTGLSFFRDGSAVYVFGYYDAANRSLMAEKIVMRNRPVMERKTLSRAEMKSMKEAKQKSAASVLGELNLTTK